MYLLCRAWFAELGAAIEIAILMLYIFIERCGGAEVNGSIINSSCTCDGFFVLWLLCLFRETSATFDETDLL